MDDAAMGIEHLAPVRDDIFTIGREELTVVEPLTCQAAVHAASDQLAGLLSDAERGALEDHLAGCDSCSCLIDQLRSTVAVLASRPEVQVPDSLRAMVAQTEGGRAEALTAQLPYLYSLANALDAGAADDLVQETLTSALADPDADATRLGLAAVLTRLADERRPDVESPAVPTAGSDPDADQAELFYPDFYTDGPDAGAWVDSPVAWGEARVLRPEDDLVTTEAYGVAETALAELDPIDAGLVTLVDIEGAPFSRAVLELDLPSSEARERLARARFKVRAALDRHFRS
jgi:DNA-directed RNA polymerase specialized sigma24 family protein